jgi:hypothetical protein
MSDHPTPKNKYPADRKRGQYPADRKPRRFTSPADWRAANKAHIKASNAVWRAANKEHLRAYKQEWFAADRNRKRGYHLRYNYGLSIEAWETLLTSQNGRCAICQRLPSELKSGRAKRQRLHVDHDHEANKIRGLLCEDCNFGIGKFSEDPEWLERAAAYLRIWHSEPAPLLGDKT